MWQVRTMLTTLAAASALAIPVPVSVHLQQPHDEHGSAAAVVPARGPGEAHGPSETWTAAGPHAEFEKGSPTALAKGKPFKVGHAYTECWVTLAGCFRRRVEFPKEDLLFPSRAEADARAAALVPVREEASSCKLDPSAAGCFAWMRYSKNHADENKATTTKVPDAVEEKDAWPKLRGQGVQWETTRGPSRGVKTRTTCGPVDGWVPGCYGIHADFSNSEPSSPVKSKTAQS